MFEAYVTNLGLYPERGAGAGEYLKFPTTVEEVQALFSRIGIDGKRYEECRRTDSCHIRQSGQTLGAGAGGSLQKSPGRNEKAP